MEYNANFLCRFLDATNCTSSHVVGMSVCTMENIHNVVDLVVSSMPKCHGNLELWASCINYNLSSIEMHNLSYQCTMLFFRWYSWVQPTFLHCYVYRTKISYLLHIPLLFNQDERFTIEGSLLIHKYYEVLITC